MRSFAARDLVLAARLLGLTVIAWTIPERHWDHIAKQFAGLRERIGIGLAPQAQHIQALTRDTPLADAATQIAQAGLANEYLEQLQLLRVHHPRGWDAPMRVEGQMHIDRALAEDRGAILWVANLSFHRQVTKMALHHAGYRIAHLSSMIHGFSETRFGIRFLNWVRTTAEDRFLTESLVPEPGGVVLVLRELAARLERNGLVSITASATAPNSLALKLFDGMVRRSVGPAKLSAQTGAPLLPVFTLRQPDGAFIVEIEAPLAAPADLRSETARRDALARYAALLEDRARRYPDQFRWHELVPTSGTGRVSV